MKINKPILILGFLGTFILANCNKENLDERDQVVGKYVGIEIRSYYDDVVLVKDTSDIIVILSKANKEPVVDVTFGSNSMVYQFTYENRKFSIVGQPYHKPTLAVTNVTLTSHYQPGLGPVWYDRIAVKE